MKSQGRGYGAQTKVELASRVSRRGMTRGGREISGPEPLNERDTAKTMVDGEREDEECSRLRPGPVGVMCNYRERACCCPLRWARRNDAVWALELSEITPGLRRRDRVLWRDRESHGVGEGLSARYGCTQASAPPV